MWYKPQEKRSSAANLLMMSHPVPFEASLVKIARCFVLCMGQLHLPQVSHQDLLKCLFITQVPLQLELLLWRQPASWTQAKQWCPRCPWLARNRRPSMTRPQIHPRLLIRPHQFKGWGTRHSDRWWHCQRAHGNLGLVSATFQSHRLQGACHQWNDNHKWSYRHLSMCPGQIKTYLPTVRTPKANRLRRSHRETKEEWW